MSARGGLTLGALFVAGLSVSAQPVSAQPVSAQPVSAQPVSAQPVGDEAGELVTGNVKVSDTAGGFHGGLADIDRFGSALAALGDLNGDGVDELVVGAPRDSTACADCGAAWVLFLNSGGRVDTEVKLGQGLGGFVGPLGPNDAFASSLARIGDLNGDGVDDLAVGAPGDADGGFFTGAVWILFLNPDGTVGQQAKIASSSGGFPLGLSAGDRFGAAVAGVGDVNGDLVPDLAVGLPGADGAGQDSGAFWVLFLNPDGTVQGGALLGNFGGPGGQLGAGDAFGSALAGLGDLDGDGVPDIAVGAPGDGPLGAGAVWVIGLASAGHGVWRHRFGSDAGGFDGALDPFDAFGSALARVPDANGDGNPELAVGAPGDDDGAPGAGASWLVFLAQDGVPYSELKISATEGGFSGQLGALDAFGSALASELSLDGNDVPELAVGAPDTDDGGVNRGASWSLFFTIGEDTPNPGTGVNPNLLVSGPNAPKLGTVWHPVILLTPPGASDSQLGDPLIDFLGVSKRHVIDTLVPGGLLGGLLLGGSSGELLISLAPEDLIYCLQGPAGANFDVPLPGDPNLVGAEIFAQGFRINLATFEELYTNGLDVVLGF